MKIKALNLHTKKIETIINSGEKDIHGKVIWVTERGEEVELETSRHFGRTSYYFSYRFKV
ncbi:MAG: hypothetical protein J6S23_01475 [Clostridia bacterium]|nr:hypothetical protein [Clostridia bacterium]